MTLLLLMTMGVTGVLAQIDFSGTYYIANETNHANGNFGTHWYLVPGADPQRPHYADAYFHNEYCNKGGKGDYTGTNYGDPEKPFLTTYQTNQDLNSIWIISSTGDGYYNIKHAKTGYYVVYEPPYKDAIHRKSMHLESTDSPGENAKFTITGSSLTGPININPKSVTSGNMYFNPAVGVGNRAQYYGTGDYYHEGMIGLYSGSGDKSQWYLEKTAIPPTITYDEETGKATITSVTGTTVRYAFDGTTPTISSTSYIEPVSMAGHTSIKAIAVDAEDNISKVVTLTLKEYTYHILNKAGTTAIEHTIKQPVGKSFTNTYTDIPAAIRSPYLEDEEVKFFNNSAHADADEIYETPSTGTDIYVTYTTDFLMDKYLHLRGARALNITINGDYVYDSGTAGSGVLSHTSDDTDIATAPYQWLFSGEDPYAVEIKNAGTNNYLGYDTPLSSPTQLLLENTSTKKFIIMNTSGSGDYQQMELMAATGDGNYYRVGCTGDDLYVSTTATGDDAQVRVYPNSATIKYELIDQAGKIIMEISSKSESVELPSDWQSPLVSRYNYWKEGAFDTYGTGDNKVYKLKEDPESYRITTLIGLEGDKIYVTYEVNDRVVFDISDDDKTHPESYQTYMLRFYQGESFNQEDGKDGIEVSAQKAEYPYSNGDAMLYVYSDTKRENQFASGASTRPRWLWYAVSPKAAKVKVGVDSVLVTSDYKGDPYHVKIMSNSSQASSHNYFRTFVVNYGGSNHVVTGVTTKNEDVSDPEDANYQPPTEYMVLSALNGRYKLVTLNEIDGAPENGTYGTRQTVNTFEQYWKNNPTVQNRLGDAKVTTSESTDGEGIELTTAQASILTGWHTYKAWANAAPWVGWSEDGKTGKKYKNKHHWFQTIDMGSTGEFAFVAQSIDPEVILLDQHGWEIMRAPLSDASALRKYDSPMVEEYQWYPTAAKVTGYHKYKVSNPNIPIYYSYIDGSGKTKWAVTGDSVTFTSTTLGTNPYTYIVERGYEDQDKSVKTDFYVTYTVRPEYAALYSGAATEGGVTPSIYMVKQGDEYAKINNSNQLDPTTDNPYSLESIGDEWHWYVKPNFNIDTEMGYKYDVDEDDGAGGTFTPNKAQKEVLNYEEGRNGFDPYNVQIQSVKSPTYYFKTSTTGSQLTKGVWEGNSTDLALDNLRRSGTTQEGIDGYDQTKLSITNATFMVVKDASDHMLLMPRFDHKKVVNSFTAPRLSAANAATQTLELLMAPKIIHSSSEFLSMNGQYTLADDFTFEDGFESLGSETNPFTGSIDGALQTLTGISTPLIAYADGAIIKNVIFNNVTIGNKEDVPNVGAIAANATGETRIYNCGILSGSVSGTGNAGSIVGNLDGSSRVINCYSYANVTGTTNTGGIVGYNAVENVSSTNLKTMVMNCMFYGDVTGGKVSPIYGGEIIDNLRINNSQKQGLNNFNYYAFEKATSFNALKDNNANKVYNNALAMEERFLTRFEIYRQLLNSNRKLAAYYATSSEATVKASDMMKWVLETADRSIDSPKEYPVLKAQAKYPSIINYDIENAPDSATVGRNHGGKLGRTLRVNISGTGVTTSQLDLERTDKDFDHFNYNYDKVQLPYFNDVGTGNYTNNQVVTGWKIIGITTIADDPYTSANYPSTGITDYPNHNYADRKSSNKDLYSVSGRVFSQGAYFDVPYGVSEITIEPYWATAAYVADEYLDVVYDAGWNGNSVTQLGKQFPTGKITINGSEQTVYKSISAALSGKTSSSVYDLAIVLVGNLHTNDVPSNGTVPFTIMSVDLDNDNEPDYSYIYSHGKRAKVSPIRFDFINVPGTAQAQKPRGATQLRNAAIFNTIGWFELTNTASMYFSQIEYENSDQSQKAPMILQGGVVDQFVSTVSHKVDGDNIYIHVGGNAWFKSFTQGTHGDGSESTPHVPVSVTGGEYESFYLTGMYNSNAKVSDDNAECYISGGRFGEVAGAGQEQIGIKDGGKGNIHWQIYNADISEFYGGGINEAKPAQGNIQTDIFNSYVDKFCGGPKFGNMATGKTVVTNATGCTFGKYFGAGNGGNSYSRKKYYDKEGVPDENTWNTLNGYYTTDRGKFFDGTTTGSSQTSGKDYGKKGYGVATDFDYEFFVWTSGTAGVRIYLNFASFSLAQCNDVTSTLTNCTINQDFYGGGNLGSVKGTATSTLNGCTVHGNVFGGGYSAELPKIPVRDAGFTKYPNFNTNSGMFEPGTFSGTTDYDWKHVANDPDNGTAGTEDSKYVLTKADLNALGQVAHTDLTVTNNCLIEGRVYGGGDMSAVNQNTLVKIENVKTSGDIQNTVSYVYGGGNTADVLGNAEVNMTSGTVSHDIYGGGRGETTKVGGNVLVNIGAKDGSTGDLSGSGIVNGDVYGGSALGDVNTTPNPETGQYDKTTNVNVYGGTVNGSVFGGGLGQEHVAARDAVGSPGDPEYVPAQAEVPAIVAKNQGNTTVTIEGGTIKTGVYGGSNVNGVLEKDAAVTLIGGTIGTLRAGEAPVQNVVFGGGKGVPTLVNGSVTVNVGTEGQDITTGATIHGNVYGGSALGNTSASKTGSDPMVFHADKKTNVYLYAGTINGNVFGGGLGQKNGVNGATSDIESFVGGDVKVLLDGAKLSKDKNGDIPLTGQIFGCNNLNGTPKGKVLVYVKRTNDINGNNAYKEDDSTPLDGRTTYDVTAVYGGGNQADYNPTDATIVLNPESPTYKADSIKVAAAKAVVYIEGCNATSIEYVYGGGNAAAVPADSITVHSAYIIGQLFGGGNGYGDDNPGANVGIIDSTAYKANPANGIYGTGIAETVLIGGKIRYVYGGSNTRGNVRGGTSLVRKTSNACKLEIKEIYGAGQVAPMDGDVNITLDCMPESFVSQVFGGAKNATVNGNVSLTVTSGKFGRVFGGNNEGGSINGSITVNVSENGCEPLIIGELYGGGFNAPYSIWGCYNDNGTWKPNTSGETPYVKEDTIAVEVNVYSCTSIGKVFGGGFGKTAEVVGNTHVYINMMKGIVKEVTQPTIGRIGQVFGGGNAAPVKGNTLIDIGTAEGCSEDAGVNIISGTYLKSTVDADTTLTAGVYGGGYSADVIGSTTLNIGTYNLKVDDEPAINIAGNIFGGGYGEKTTVRDSVTVNIGKKKEITVDEVTTYSYEGYANITGDVYGGSAMGKVNATKGGTEESPTYTKTANAITQVNFYGGTINGNIYGGGEGQRAVAGPPAVAAIAADVYGPVTVTMEKGSTTNTVVNNVFGCNNFNGAPQDTVVVKINGGTVYESVYGGGNKAEYTAPVGHKDYPAVRVVNGTITKDVFGGGLGTTATVAGNPHVTIGDNDPNHKVAIKWSVYGGGSLATVDGSTYIVVNSDTIGTKDQGGAKYGNIYGGGFGSDADVRNGLVKVNTNITVNGGTILHNIYGGGALASVGTYTYASEAANAAITGHTENTGKATITILGGTIGTNGQDNGMVFGSSRGDIDAPGEIHDNLAWVYDTDVTIGTNGSETGPTINGSLYGGGENGHVYNDAKVTMYSGTVGNMDEYYSYRGNVYGAGCGTDMYWVDADSDGEKDTGEEFYNPKAGIVNRNATVIINGGSIANNVYGAGSMGKVGGSTSVTINTTGAIGVDGSHGDGNVYGAARGELNLKENHLIPDADDPNNYSFVTNSSVTISKGTVKGSVFGGGKAGIVKGNVNVLVNGGVVKNDVYGGGALANTNTDNWNTSGSTIVYVPVDPSEFSPTYSIKEVAVGKSVEGLYTYNSSTSEYEEADGVAVKGTTYYQYVSGSSVAGYYTRSVSEPYVYTLVPSGSAAGGTTYYKKKVVGDWKASHPHTTTVVLTGGVIGNAYGGGLGSSTVAANVYGDVKVTVNKPEEMSSTGGSGIAFTRNTVTVTYGEGDKRKEYIIPVTGRVFGCNNINGTPTGNVEVEVYGTRQIEINGQDNYTLYPIAGEGSEHSPNGHNRYYEVQAVYGGGNLSDYLPATGKATSVYITGCDSTSIEKVYGGGNSAVVPSSNVVINGSYDIGTAFGGGNGGDLVQKNGTWYENDGAIVIGKALIKPKGGKVGEIFGGSDAKGYCGNPIIDKTEHNDLCPLVVTRMYGAGKESDVDNVDIVISGCTGSNTQIEYVFGGSYNAHVAGYINLTITAGVFKNVFGGNDRTGSIGGNITVNIEETENCEKPLIIQNLFGGGNEAAYPGTRRNGTEITTPGKITVNVKSATRIDNVFGGSFKADVNGDTEVNINMTKGFWAGKTYQGNLIPDSVGVIGNIYGGGNQGVVRGNSKVNICTADSVGYKTIPAHLSYREKGGLYYVPVTGARITGDVFGGGSEANVNGNDTVNICTADYSGIAGFQGVAISKGSVYGGGSAGDVLGNTFVTMSGSRLVDGKYVHDAYVYDGVYGGGLMGSVGTFTRDSTVTTESNGYNHSLHKATCLGKPVSCKVGTGKCTVVISGGQVGPIEVATKGMKNVGGDGPVDVGFVFGAGRGEVEDPDVDKDADFHTYVNATEVIIKNKYAAGHESAADSLSYVVSKPIIMASVYGGGENGRVLDSTYVKIYGGQIGSGDTETAGGKTVPRIYTEAEWATADSTVFKECLSWDLKSPFLPYDPYGTGDASTEGSDGHTYYGSVFGGGSGYFPYKKANGTHAWLRSAGAVFGNTRIDITAGHILTSVYGGNETTDVGTYTKNDKGYPIVWSSGGKCTINMVGGTIGVPRSVQRMKDHPVTCYLFGAGKGDQRTSFNTWTNVQETEVNVSGKARIFGSIFGGGEDGHILGNAKVNIGDNVIIGGTTYTAQSGLKIGTTGTSYVDGNVFGGGRGFSGVALTAGSTGGNVEVNIKGGTMLGSIYGGGRLASVGIGFTPPEDIYYGQLIDDVDENHNDTMEPSELKHGHITINISGGTIGNGTTEAGAGHPVSGNVFGGSMGRLTLLDGVTRIPLWPKQSVTKESKVTISGGTIYNSVYGGSELGIVRNRATVNVSGTADIRGNVFGGGYGSDEQDKKTISAGGYASIPTVYYTFTPMIWTGCVSGDTYVNISGGKIGKSVYGGGNYASVGLMNYNSSEDGKTYNYIKKHDTTNGFGLSWPYEFQYIQAAPTDDAPGGKAIGGKTTINITGGRIGTTVSTDNAGFVYGGSKGQVSFNKADNTTHITDIDEQVYAEAFCANVRETEITINYASTPESDDGSTTPCIVRSVYGGGEDGHVMENAVVKLQQGWIGRTLFGGGKGTSTYKGTKYVYNGSSWTLTDNQDIHSWTAGKVYGNTTVTITGGKVGWFVYGGGNMASVGKGNYAGGADDYSTAGYGETLNGNETAADKTLWDGGNANSVAFLNSGKATINLFGGTIGTATAGFNDDGIPYGSVFGGSRGTAAIETSDVATLSPLYNHIPEYYAGYVNKTVVNVGGTSTSDLSTNTPTIYGSLYGGAQDGHVRNSTEVKIFKGNVAGQTSDAAGRSGHIFGAGSGIGTYTDPSDSKNKINSSSGSVTCTTLVELNGGSIAGNIYGGGAMASVGPPKIGDKNEQHAPSDGHKSISKTQVDVKGGSVGGSVYGACRGPGDAYYKSQFTDQELDYDKTKFATDIWSDVTVSGGTIGNNVYGGGQGGIVKENTTVSLTGGRVYHNAYGGGQGTTNIAADILGNTTIELNKDVETTAQGCIVEKIFGCNDLNGTPKGHALVHVYATQHPNTTDNPHIEDKYEKFGDLTKYTVSDHSGLATYATAVGMTFDQQTAYETAITSAGTDSLKNVKLNEYIDAIADKKYDVLAVYGGGDLAAYDPTDAHSETTSLQNAARTEVIIDGCAVTSIKQVYGGGNAASTPATYVRVNEAYEINELFGGGNGKDDYKDPRDGKWYQNPGANVGYWDFTETGTGSGDSAADPILQNDKSNARTKEDRIANYSYGSGVATSEITGGRIHYIYGGSNSRGNIRAEAASTFQESGTCALVYDKSYGAGKDATTDAHINVVLDCVESEIAKIFGGSTSANVNSDIDLVITNGVYGEVYGGNDTSGKIYGSIKVTVKEMGCKPVYIGKLYGGGYLADYSVYGYKGDGSVRTKSEYETAYETAIAGKVTEEEKAAAIKAAGLEGLPYTDPHVLVVSATKIDTVYGGGYKAKVVGNPHVNVNMEQGHVLAKYAKGNDNFDIGPHTVGGRSYTVDGVVTEEGPTKDDALLAIGTIGSVYGGGNLADIIGDTYVEIGTGTYHNDDGEEVETSPYRNVATIKENVFGGGRGEALESGEDAFYCKSAMVGVDGDGVDHPDGGTTVIIANGTVGTIEAGKLKAGTGNVYGGGEIGRVEKNTVVTIGVEGATGVETKFRPTVLGSVFGAGKGVETHGYSALVRGNSTVTIQGVAKVGQSVYGGGEKASIGRYHVAETDEEAAAHGVEKGMPYSLLSDNSGSCTVIVRDSAEVGPNDMIMTRAGGPDNSGHVFGAGQGVNPYEGYSSENKPWRMTIGGTKEIYNTATAADTLLYLKYVESLGLATQTDVTIGGNAFVKGDVFGGAEQGFVQHDTKVTIQDNCQIGGGYVQMNDAGEYLASPYSLNRRYTPTEWADGRLYKDGESNYQHSLPECASWRYESPYAPHDKFAGTAGYDSKGGATTATNGSTFYGNVFGGGSGYFPYAAGKWHWKSGDVGGNTVVNITGGHILTNVYGGNELTNVEGSVTVNFGGTATLGVPRTLGQITNHPVTCYLFGAGKGDPRVLFNKQTNVKNARVNVTGGRIYGSVFGGGEDGHVLRNDTVIIGNDDHTGPTIGTWGTSYVDGNVFGGGRGFEGNAYTAGNVGGSVTMNIKGGTMLGSIYGGGRLGSVGYGLYEATETEAATGHKMYGEMQDDGYEDWYKENTTYTRKADNTFKRGHVEINISGGTIGNDLEYIMPNATNIAEAGIAETDISKWKAENVEGSEWTIWKTYYKVPSTTYDASDGKLHHTRGGNVYAGGMGRRLNLNGQVISMSTEGINWLKLGNVKSTKLTITGGTIKSNVYGGGEYGAVRGNHMVSTEALSTEISITGGTIGTEILDTSAPGETKPVVYTYGSVFGGGTGTTDDVAPTTSVAKADTLGAYVADSTRVTLTNAIVKASVFGGGELAAVGGSTHVTVSGTTKIGRNEVYGIDEIYKLPDIKNPGYVKYGSWRMGNVYGGGRGSEAAAIAGLVEGNTNVLITGGNVYHNVYGGGALGSVGRFYVKGADDGGSPQGNMPEGLPYWTIGPDGASGGNTGIATVTITGGQIGISGRDNGLVFGSSRGDISTPTGTPAVDQYDRVAWVRGTVVNIGTPGAGRTSPLIKGSVYGGGENGHNYQNAIVNINSGTIGIADKIPGTETPDPWWTVGDSDLDKEYRAYRGNVYGAGSGTDTYKIDGKPYHNPRAGMVGGSTIVNIAGGHIGRSVYGAGAMASVGNVTNVRDTLDVSKGGTGTAKHADVATGFALSWPYKLVFAPMTGKATVNVRGGHIGTQQVDGGDVYGSARGEAGDRYASAHMAYANETEVNITYPATAAMPSVTAIQNNYDTQCITGSVHGSGENGFVYGDAKVTLNKGLIGHSIYGAGRGKDRYPVTLKKIGSDVETYTDSIYSLIAGKVFGNTYVTMNDGHVGRNVYGGGNMGSVGKGNFAGGSDDYVNDCTIGAAQGYGETLNGNDAEEDRILWTPSANFDPTKPITIPPAPGALGTYNQPITNADYFLSSGKTTVKVLGGIVGYIDSTNPDVSMKNELPYGNVFGGSAGEAAPNVADDPSHLYLYSPAFFSGYVNETDVTIGTSGQATDEHAGETGYAPLIYGSVYGGGQDGHVRRDTKVTVYSGEIGKPYNATNISLLKTDNLDSPQWMHRGNVYGGGSGITQYVSRVKYADTYPVDKRIEPTGYSTSSGSVTRSTEVNILGGIIHRNVYGGGSNGSIGAPYMEQGYLPYKPGQADIDDLPANGPGRQSLNSIKIGGGSSVAVIGTPFDVDRGWTYNKLYGGEVYGACRGLSTLNPEQFANSIWTTVNIFDKSTIMGNVYGGGDNGIVKKDSEVKIGGDRP
ncbi:MAG: chitobiase/beta-hexosaminidase C-terminal domain-containing protein [Prevotella sp.]|nr:chitobiase/beta-hexosaminidase C-terminal domain-containing protein [Prevotella sp.]